MNIALKLREATGKTAYTKEIKGLSEDSIFLVAGLKADLTSSADDPTTGKFDTEERRDVVWCGMVR